MVNVQDSVPNNWLWVKLKPSEKAFEVFSKSVKNIQPACCMPDKYTRWLNVHRQLAYVGLPGPLLSNISCANGRHSLCQTFHCTPLPRSRAIESTVCCLLFPTLTTSTCANRSELEVLGWPAAWLIFLYPTGHVPAKAIRGKCWCVHYSIASVLVRWKDSPMGFREGFDSNTCSIACKFHRKPQKLNEFSVPHCWFSPWLDIHDLQLVLKSVYDLLHPVDLKLQSIWPDAETLRIWTIVNVEINNWRSHCGLPTTGGFAYAPGDDSESPGWSLHIQRRPQFLRNRAALRARRFIKWEVFLVHFGGMRITRPS